MGNDEWPGFAPVSAKQWKQQIQYELSGADYNESLVWESPEGLQVKPFYSEEDLSGHEPLILNRRAGWRIAETVEADTAEKANRQARMALEGGVEALVFHIPREGVSPVSLLQGIDTEQIELHFRCDFLSLSYVQSLRMHLPGEAAGTFLHLDPIGKLVQTGTWHGGRKRDLETLGSMLQALQPFTGIHPLGVDGRPYQEAGANRVQELAYCLVSCP